MRRSLRATAGAALMAALVVTLGTGPAAGGPFRASERPAPVDGWVVENPRPDGTFDAVAGSATIADTVTGDTISCTTVDGWGNADSGTLRPQDWFAWARMTTYTSCTGLGGTWEYVFSPEIRVGADHYDPATDRITGDATVDIWGLFPTATGCDLSLYPIDPQAEVPMTYDNRSHTMDIGPVELVVEVADGPGCAGLPEVGDRMTFETTLVASPGFTVRPA